MLPLSKTLDPADLALLPKELKIVDQYFASVSPQHPLRRWEYALALRAMTYWLGALPSTRQHFTDVGGAGSPFASIAGELGWHPELIDPAAPSGSGRTLAEEVVRHPRLADVVTCISVLEHVEDLDRFCYHLSCLVAPGGLLFLTVDYCDAPTLGDDPPDFYHFSWMRKRIFNAYTLARRVAGPFQQRDFLTFGAADFTWHGPQVYDYSFASLALVKRT